MFVELHAASAFSFLEGASVPEEMAAVCQEQGIAAMALLDRDGLYGAPRFHYAMKKAGLRAHIGSEITANLALRRAGNPEIGGSGNRKAPMRRDTSSGFQISRFSDVQVSRLPLLVGNR